MATEEVEGSDEKVGGLSSAEWDRLLNRALAGEGITIVHQPILDLQRVTVAGYEALARFEGSGGLGPDAVFAAARARGVSALLDAVVVAKVLDGRRGLPPGSFLSLNLEPDSLGHPDLDACLLEQRLGGIVLELTEHMALGSDDTVERFLERYRHQGALVAIDDAGSGYAGLDQILRLRPGVLKLDRSLVAGLDRDEAKRSLVEMLGVFADRIDAWILAEGVERIEEAAVLRELGVPLAQGFLFATPGPGWPTLPLETRRAFLAALPPGPDQVAGTTIESLVSWSPSIGLDELDRAAGLLGGDESLSFVVIVDEDQRAVGLVDRDSALIGGMRVPLAVHFATGIVEVARRMLHRNEPDRFRPIVCHDEQGRYLGIVRPERLVASLVGLATGNRASEKSS